MPGGTDDKQQGGNGNDPDEASKLKQAAADLTKLAQNAARDNPKKADAKSTKDSAGSSGSKRNDKQTEEEDGTEEDKVAEAGKIGDVSR